MWRSPSLIRPGHPPLPPGHKAKGALTPDHQVLDDLNRVVDGEVNQGIEGVAWGGGKRNIASFLTLLLNPSAQRVPVCIHPAPL